MLSAICRCTLLLSPLHLYEDKEKKTTWHFFQKDKKRKAKLDIPLPPVLNHLNRYVKNDDFEDIDQVLVIEDSQYWIIQYQLNLE